MKLTMYLSLVDGSTWAGPREILERTVETDQAPTPGVDDVVLWSTEEGPGGGPTWSIKRRYMNADGSWVVELSHMVIDPSDTVHDTIMRDIAQGRNGYRQWWTQTDGDPRPKLLAGGWHE